MGWTPEAIERLKALWAEGHSTMEIARRMGISKNAIVGKAHRLNLKSRPNPIIRGGVPPAPRPPRTPRTPAPRRDEVAPAPKLMMRLPQPRVAFGPPEPSEQQAERLAAERGEGYGPRPVIGEPQRRTPLWLGQRTCSWPLGEPGTHGFRFCGDDPFPGKPYCTEHAAIAYVKPRDRRADAAD